MKKQRTNEVGQGCPKARRQISRQKTRSAAKMAKEAEAPDPEPEPLSAPQLEEPILGPADNDQQPYDGETAIKLYLREIGQVKLLTPPEEVELAARIKKGDKKAREMMIKANLRLVVKIAHDYENFGLPLLDLISEGNIGLMKAVERFDPAKGGKLSTYGSWWIKQSIKRALANQSKTIRLPVHLVDKISRMRQTALKLQEIFGREPTDEELAEEMGMSVSRVAQMRTAAIRPASLDAPIGDDDTNSFAEVVQDESANTPYDTSGGENRHRHVAGDGQDPGRARIHHPVLPFWPGRRERKNPGRSGRKIWRDARTRAADPKHRADQAAQDDREDRGRQN